MSESAAQTGRTWAWGVVGACILFISVMLGFVVFSFSQQVDLVSRDYYQREIEHQRQIDRVARTRSLPEDVAWELSQEVDQAVFAFPQDQVEEEVRGRIHLYRPADASLDRKWEIALDRQGRQRVPLASLEPGRWRVKIDWRLGGEEYYSEFALTVE
jgi:hypothetical protein